MKRDIIIILLLIFSLSCEKIVDMDVPQDPPSLVVNSFFHPDDTIWNVRVSQTRYILNDESFSLIDDALVIISDEDGLKDTLVADSIYFTSTDFLPQPNKTYSILVDAPGFSTQASALDQVPDKIEIVSASIDFQDRIGDYVAINVIFDDPAGPNNYKLIIQTNKIVDAEVFPPKRELTNTYIFSDDTQLKGVFSRSEQGILFKDDTFDGDIYQLKVYIDENNFYGLAANIDDYKVVVLLRNITDHYYNYNTSVDLQRNADGNFLSDPVPVYNNIEGGFGVFAAYNQDADTIFLFK